MQTCKGILVDPLWGIAGAVPCNRSKPFAECFFPGSRQAGNRDPDPRSVHHNKWPYSRSYFFLAATCSSQAVLPHGPPKNYYKLLLGSLLFCSQTDCRLFHSTLYACKIS